MCQGDYGYWATFGEGEGGVPQLVSGKAGEDPEAISICAAEKLQVSVVVVISVEEPGG